jgi:hypothetical protein
MVPGRILTAERRRLERDYHLNSYHFLDEIS